MSDAPVATQIAKELRTLADTTDKGGVLGMVCLLSNEDGSYTQSIIIANERGAVVPLFVGLEMNKLRLATQIARREKENEDENEEPSEQAQKGTRGNGKTPEDVLVVSELPPKEIEAYCPGCGTEFLAKGPLGAVVTCPACEIRVVPEALVRN